MESNNSNVNNSTFSGNSTLANVPRDGGTTEINVGSVLSQIEERLSQIEERLSAYQGLGASGERMADVVNSSTQTLIPERGDDDAGQNLNMQNMFYAAVSEHHTRILTARSRLRLLSFYSRIKLRKYQLPKSTCLDSNERCSICLDDYHEQEKLAEIDCGHIYHINCIKEWVMLQNSCPICRRDALAILT